MTVSKPLDRDRCRELLAPHLQDLQEIFLTAWTRWQNWVAEVPGSPNDVSTRSRASSLHDFIAAAAETRFLGTPGVTVARKRGLLVLRFNDKLVLRFKKFRGKSLKTSSNATQQTLTFDAHQLELADMAVQPVTHLTAGYRLNDLATAMSQLAVTCSVDGDHYWAPIDISEIASVHTAPITSVTTTDPTVIKPGVRSTRRRRVEDTE
ncbi:hypothetical protein AB0C38_03100 [Amycolatopsis sp. NPDC048633]|uniref:hypothetical protein n=1 Tax=Amycolatopsis sp. NPDC048633 TaxID=3157095 RepID=UPI0033ED035E